MGGIQSKTADKAEPVRNAAPAAVAPSAAAVKAPTQTGAGAAAAPQTASTTSQIAAPTASASSSSSSWAKTTPTPWAQKDEGAAKGPTQRPVSAAPSRALAVDTAHRRGSDPDPFDDSTESVDKVLKGKEPRPLSLSKDLKAGTGAGVGAQGVTTAQSVRALAVDTEAVPIKQPEALQKPAAKEMVPPLRLSVVTDEIKEGSLIEGNYAQIGEWFTGKITKKRSDGTYDILYDDGDVELGVKQHLVRLRR